MDHTTSPTGRGARRRHLPLVIAIAVAVLTAGLLGRADAAGLNLPIAMGQRFVGSASAPKPILLPLSTKVGPIKNLAVDGINHTTFAPIKDPVLGITIFSSDEVKQIVLDTVTGLGDNTVLSFKVNAINHPDPTEFILGGNCVGADGLTTPFCVANVVFKPTSPGAKSDPLTADITITQGMSEIETSLQNALSNQGIKGALVNLIYPLARSYVQNTLTDGIEGALLSPFATVTGTGVAGPFTDPTAFIKRQFADFAAGPPTSSQITTWVKNFEAGGAPAGLTDSLRTAPAWDGRVGPVTRLYSAYFLRAPEQGGLSYWVAKSRSGFRLTAISSVFASSSEFQHRYGSLSNSGFVTLVYQNVLGRSPDSSGLAYWTKQLASGKTRGSVMVGFSESTEHTRKQAPKVTAIEIWFGMLHRTPSAAELTSLATRLGGTTKPTTVINEVLASNEYRALIAGS